MPKVSICVPNLNTLPYLPERFESIFKQTLQDWELIVSDNYSEDGAWEFVQDCASRDGRIRASQARREGMYANWNNCIRQARADYVYIATSDDTMMPECLEKMVSALEANADCGVCQCELVIIDEKGMPFPQTRQWNQYTLGSYCHDLVAKRNKRFAPHDGIVHPALFTIYTSITQLLIRRSVFDRIGLFDGQWGSVGDFEWDMRAGLVENCIYIPEKLATWRVHPNQATGDMRTPKVRLKMIEMAYTAFARAAACKGANLGNIGVEDFVYFLERDFIELSCRSIRGKRQKSAFLLKELFHRPRPVIHHLLSRFNEKRWGPWNDIERHRRLTQTLEKHKVPAPVY